MRSPAGVGALSGQIRIAAAVRIGCGPISISTVQPRLARVPTLSANRHRLPGVPSPVLRIEAGSPSQHLAGPIADESQLRRRIFETACVRLELVEHGLEQRGMERVTGIQPLAADSRLPTSEAATCSRSSTGPDSTVLAPL